MKQQNNTHLIHNYVVLNQQLTDNKILNLFLNSFKYHTFLQ